MKIPFLFAVLTVGTLNTFGQDISNLNDETFLKSSSDQACKCIDSISVYNKSKADISKEIGRCIDEEVVMYQTSAKLFGAMDLEKAVKSKKKEQKVEIAINTNKESAEYKNYYYKLERYLMDSCKVIKEKVASDNKASEHSVTENPKALAFYNEGYKEMEKENYKGAAEAFEKALKVDPLFTFAWDNLGLAYRKLENYDKAIDAYNSSLKIDPNNITPLQNLAVAYQYKKQFDKSIATYERLAKIDTDNPEIYYGIGQVYTMQLKDYENGLNNLCKAYNLYIKQKSPYRTDAESLIAHIYTEMKKEKKEDKFNEILKANNISTQ